MTGLKVEIMMSDDGNVIMTCHCQGEKPEKRDMAKLSHALISLGVDFLGKAVGTNKADIVEVGGDKKSKGEKDLKNLMKGLNIDGINLN